MNHPDIAVRLHTAVLDVDFQRDAADVAIQFGTGQWPNVDSDFLFGDEIAPVCLPAYLTQHAPASTELTALLQGRLLVSRYRRTD